MSDETINKENGKPSFLKNHVDTLAIIGVNIAIATILVSLWISNSHRIDASNSRFDQMQALIYQEMKDFHGELERQDAEFKAHLMYHHDKK